MNRDFTSGLIGGLEELRAAKAKGDKLAVEAAGKKLDEHVGSMEKLARYLNERRREVRPSFAVQQMIDWIQHEAKRPARWNIATWGMMSDDHALDELKRFVDPTSERTEFIEPNRVPWDREDPAYYPNIEAIRDAHLAGQNHEIKNLRELDLDRLKRLLRSAGCTIRFMSRTKPPRGRVHKADWQQYLKAAIRQEEVAKDTAERILGELS